MKFNFRKISAIAVSALMTGMTMGVAAAANYPAPFVSGGTANAAIVYGTGSGVSNLDFIEAGNIQTSLAGYLSGKGPVTVEGGESFVLEKTNDKFNLGDSINFFYPKLNDVRLPNFLADGTYDDGDIDVDYSQEITLKSKTLELFADKDYNNKEPTFGFQYAKGNDVLEYTITFDEEVEVTDMNKTNMPIMDKEFYVKSASDAGIVLFDSAQKDIISESETKVVSGKSVSITYIDKDVVKFNVDGTTTKSLKAGESAKLSDGSYIIVNEVMYASKDSGISKVDFSIGKGEIKLTKAVGEVKLNDKAIKGLEASWTSDTNNNLKSLTLSWKADKKSFLAKENALVMPAPFDSIRLVFNGLDFPSTSEKIEVEAGETLTLVMENYELPLMYVKDAGTAILGEEDNPLLLAIDASGANYATGKFTEGYVLGNNTAINQVAASGTPGTAITTGIEVTEDNRFLVTYITDELSDVQTLYYEIRSISLDDDNKFSVEFEDLIGNNDFTLDEKRYDKEIGDVEVTLAAVSADDGYAYLVFSKSGSGTLAYDKAVSETGMVVTLPTVLTGIETPGVSLTFTEQNKDGDVNKGDSFTATITRRGSVNDYKLHVSATNVDTVEKSKKVNIGYNPSELATKVTHDTNPDDNVFEIEYYGQEVIAKVMVVGGDATVSSGETNLGDVLLVKDKEVGSVATKNLIVVGGSCINSAAAALIGGAKCGAAWTEATGVGTGQFLIKGYSNSPITTKLALLVAGYEAEDTVKASTYLRNKAVDTSKSYKGTTSTETAVVIE